MGYWLATNYLQKTIENDGIKDDILFANGFNLLRIPEREYKNGKEETVLKCLKFINEAYYG